MRIGLDLLYLLPGVVNGTATYALRLIGALGAVDDDTEYVVFLNQEARDVRLPDSPRFQRVVCPFNAIRRPVRYAWEQLILPWQLRRHKIDLLHSLGYVTPLFAPCPTVVTIHDLNFMAPGHYMSAAKRAALRFFSGGSARRANHVITDSHFSAREIIDRLHISPGKISIIHLGAGIAAEDATGTPRTTGTPYRLPVPYIVAFGRPGRHKNICRLLAAYEQLGNAFPHKLVLIGYAPSTCREQAERLGERLINLGYVPEEYIMPVLGQADLFVLPSLYEGFGLSVLEAQTAGTAVACAGVASLPEVGGEGALYFDPQSVDEMAEVMRRCLSDDGLRARLSCLGRENVSRFSWQKAALETLNVYEKIVLGRRPYTLLT